MSNREISVEEVRVDALTWREQEVLALLAERRTNREIANRLHLAESTVKDYVGKIISKLYVKNRRQAVERAKALGLLEPDRKTLVEQPTHIPAEPTSFVGRRDELVEINRLLEGTRLLTLTGPGGIGKTRLALKAAEGASSDFADGIFFVALAPISSTEHIIQTIAEGLRFPLATQEDPQHQLLRFLQRKRLLLVMDNFEHVLDGVGIVSEILWNAPEVRVLATSREKLNLQSETTLFVGGMEVPGRVEAVDSLEYDAIALFVQRAAKVRPGFEPSSNELGQIVKICHIVGGMPLAIELAASWLHVLNVDEIAGELERGLDILTSDARDAPARHRSIHAVFDHSWSMLTQAERDVFMRLSVFRGGFTRQAAQQVTGASLQLLAGLVNKSFLSHDPSAGRLEVHELLRQYAHERLGERPEASAAAYESHAAYFATFMEQRWKKSKGWGQLQALAEIEADIQNVRAAWRYDLARRYTPQLWKFIKCLWFLYWLRWWNHAGMELFAEAVRVLGVEEDDDEETRALVALAMAYQGYFMAWLDLADQGYEMAKIGVEMLEQHDYPEALVFAYDSLTVNAYMLNLYAVEHVAIEKMVEIASGLDDRWFLAFALFAAGMSALIRDDFVAAKRVAEEELRINEEIGDVIGSTLPLIVLGHQALARGEYGEARGHYLRCLDISQKVGFHYAIQTSTKYLGKVALSLGKIEEAEDYLVQSLRITKEIGFVRDIINLLFEFARLRAAQGDPEGSAELLALVLLHPASYKSRFGEGRIRDSAKELLARLETELPQAAYTAALARGQGMGLDVVVLELVGSESRLKD